MPRAVRDPFSEILDLRRPPPKCQALDQRAHHGIKSAAHLRALSSPSSLTLCSSQGSCADGEAIQARPVPHGIQAQPWTR